MICKKCNTQLKEETRFCTNCGYKIILHPNGETLSKKNNEKTSDRMIQETNDPIGLVVDAGIAKAKIFLPKYCGELILLSGSGLFTFNIFLLIFGKYEKGSDFSLNFGDISLSPTPLTHNYSHNALWLATIGVLLIIVGILIIRNKSLISK